MLWYFIDGKNRAKQEAAIEDRGNFNEYIAVYRSGNRFFYKAKDRPLVMQLPNKKYIASSYKITHWPAIMKFRRDVKGAGERLIS